MKISFFSIFFFSFLLVSQKLFATALICEDLSAGSSTLKIKSNLILYGDLSSQEAQHWKQLIKRSIDQYWNQIPYQWEIKNRFYSIVTEVNVQYVDESKIRNLRDKYEQDYQFQFFRLHKGGSHSVTASFVLGHGRSGVLLLSDLEKSASTAAHEFGHTLGLAHPEEGPIVGRPGMMATQFYPVEEKYQGTDGKLNLSLRKVSKQELKNLNMEKFDWGLNPCHWLGQKASIFLFDHDLNVQ